MTEAEWLAATDPQAMLDFLRDTGRVTDRKVRLFAAACVRQVWHLLTDGRGRQAVEAAEQYADGLAAAEGWGEGHPGGPAGQAAVLRVMEAALHTLGRQAHRLAAQGAANEEAEEDRACEAWAAAKGTPAEAAAFEAMEAGGKRALVAGDAGPEGEGRRQRHLFRDVFGNPFRPLPPLPARNDGTVQRLAQAAYDERLLPSGHLDPARLAVLCDALLDAGCPADAEVLLHLRGEGPHVRGCHALDWVLGRG